jgi:hypothetical protein
MGVFGNEWDFVVAGALVLAAIIAIAYYQR